jgi:hypothetical protein
MEEKLEHRLPGPDARGIAGGVEPPFGSDMRAILVADTLVEHTRLPQIEQSGLELANGELLVKR